MVHRQWKMVTLMKSVFRDIACDKTTEKDPVVAETVDANQPNKQSMERAPETSNVPATRPPGKKVGQVFQCHICFRKLKNKTGLKLHIRSCKNEPGAVSHVVNHLTTLQNDGAPPTLADDSTQARNHAR